MTVSCFVYYRVAPDHVAEASRAARRTLEQMRIQTGIDGQLMTKVNEPLLWMEVYDDIEDETTFLSAMRECVAQTNLARWLEGERQRHTEIFQTAAFTDETP
ncbi:MAG: DUF4936 family protein [Betaproteobacteria bacterium]|nr:MAG: DUF4936 family protein [Betaproteobacteria bacterium]